MKRIVAIIAGIIFSVVVHAQQFYDVTKYGARKDSSVKATQSIAQSN